MRDSLVKISCAVNRYIIEKVRFKKKLKIFYQMHVTIKYNQIPPSNSSAVAQWVELWALD